MSRAKQCVQEFHEFFGLPVRDPATEGASTGSESLRELRVNLIAEEAQEFADAVRADDIIAMADALADLLYVTYGAAISHGIDLDAVLEEVHRSNMTKLWGRKDIATLPGPGDGTTDGPYGSEGAGLEAVEVRPGKYVVYREDGKVLKPPSYSAPNILAVLMKQRLKGGAGTVEASGVLYPYG